MRVGVLKLRRDIVKLLYFMCILSIQLGKLDKEGSHKILDRFVALGGNFIDTANMYTRGVSESIIGEWLVK